MYDDRTIPGTEGDKYDAQRKADDLLLIEDMTRKLFYAPGELPLPPENTRQRDWYLSIADELSILEKQVVEADNRVANTVTMITGVLIGITNTEVCSRVLEYMEVTLSQGKKKLASDVFTDSIEHMQRFSGYVSRRPKQ